MPEKKQYRVEEFMSTKVTTLHEDATIADAIQKMLRHKTNGLVIVDKNKKVVGILSSWDIIEYVVPDYLEEDKHLATFESGKMFEKRVRDIANHSIAECMTSRVHTIKPDHTLIEAATLLSEFHIRQLPVVDQDGILIGYINRTDIKRAMGEVLGLTED
ncbi:MAG: hypothetical protein A3B74_04545 [Candidatus Kerfeldbacteria bacterium RIFCSPHIGHO2_02_FULL_42_14]|uniref:CBS domain-containing protein n=1 Tax=Candidatus Kerfeldbacteria bacterium RIFCSPHIGHO2_02_FULL_42_14 TaxID=1798540 RepID=A0A1G2ANZ2_9BACT|nr:MAG: hypothetical protein A3B74_04545 [Candidatus Kerfeldbacteria bacterium RIFCSPHIGHO2_02_FULL_42_14]OGY82143.1 MAG: hypothetical protein A3E60_00275 [Candidatus Kerfeldbacteria bacterium RIFCSPHIGHO2_12_FULL_42_13]OGY84968.1 MAG: hypothetical protein A3I91_00610 [Candidatus Kerfeldbacteria bacterium RIFCSPLOWO2_02_FULL_42_19]OGY86136.1 MAG: hypothetical protein A3G01_02145 [Candidatus Kerfeldbacteria bacterium RIFCSPLOWO2_12_FULL_43_9]